VHNKKQTDHGLSNPTIGVFAAASIALTVTLLWSFPLILSPTDSILGHPGDSLTALSRWEHWQISGRYVDRPLLNTAGSLLSRLLGPIASYNVVVLSSFPLAAATAFLFFRSIVTCPASALVAALVFALCPYHWARSQGHVYLAHIQWIPLVCLASVAFLANPSVLRGIAFLISFLLLLASSFYYGFFTALIAITLLILGLIRGAAARRFRGYWRVIVIFVLGIIGTLPITYSYLTWLSSRPAPRVELLDELFRYTARVREYLLPGSFSGLGRIWNPQPLLDSLHRSNEVEQAIFIGWIPLLLAIIGLAALVKYRPGNTRHDPAPWNQRAVAWVVAAGIVALLYSAPPAVNVFGRSILLPNYYISRIVPFFRSYVRMSIFVQLMVSTLAAVGLTALSRCHGGRTIAAVVLLLSIVEFTPVPPPRVSRMLPPKPAYLWLARAEYQQDTPAIVEFPFNTRVTPRTSFRTYFQRLHGHTSLDELPSFDLRHTSLVDVTHCLDLRSAGVALILLHHSGPEPVLQIYKDRPERGRNRPGAWPRLPAGKHIHFHAHLPGTVVCSLDLSPAPISITRSDGVGPWLENRKPVGAPMSDTAGFLVHSGSRRPISADIDLVFRRVRPVGSWNVFVNGLSWGVVPQTADTLALSVSEVELLPGVNTLRLQARCDSLKSLDSQAAQPVAVLLRARVTLPKLAETNHRR
jgi:hypothetical protein